MKLRLIYLAILLTQPLSAQQLKVDAGGLIIHMKYKQQEGYFLIPDTLRPDRYHAEHFKTPFKRVVLRPQVGVSYKVFFGDGWYYQAGAFIGQDCLYGNILGGVFDIGLTWKYIQAGATAGGYLRDGELWRKNHFTGDSFIPIIGINVTIKKDFDKFSIGMENRVTPILLTHNIFIGIKL